MMPVGSPIILKKDKNIIDMYMRTFGTGRGPHERHFMNHDSQNVIGFCILKKHESLPSIANIHHGVFGLFSRDVFRTLGFLRFLRLLVARAVWPDLRLFLRTGAALEGGRGRVQAETLTHCRSLREKHPAWDYMIYTCKMGRANNSVTRRRYNEGDSL